MKNLIYSSYVLLLFFNSVLKSRTYLKKIEIGTMCASGLNGKSAIMQLERHILPFVLWRDHPAPFKLDGET